MNQDKETRAATDQRERILGISFFNGTAAAAVTAAIATRGCVAIPASPALIKLNYDEEYRQALREADLVLPDSGLLARLWRLATGRPLSKISGIHYLRCLLGEPSVTQSGNTLWIVPSEPAKEKALAFLRKRGCEVVDDCCHVAARSSASFQDHAVLLKLEERRPQHVVIALQRGGQESLGIYLRDYLLYRPTIHCVGAALGFLTGDEAAIPEWAQRYQLGWLARLKSQPSMLLPRLGIALAFAAMVFRYRSELPPLRTRWTDL